MTTAAVPEALTGQNQIERATIAGSFPKAGDGRTLLDRLRGSTTLHIKAGELKTNESVNELLKSLDAFLQRNGFSKVMDCKLLSVAKAFCLLMLTDCMKFETRNRQSPIGIHIARAVQTIFDFQPELLTADHMWPSMHECRQKRGHEAFTPPPLARSLGAIFFRNDLGVDGALLTPDCVSALSSGFATAVNRLAGKKLGRIPGQMFEFMVEDGRTLETMKSVSSYLRKTKLLTNLVGLYSAASLRIQSSSYEQELECYISILIKTSEYLKSNEGAEFWRTLFAAEPDRSLPNVHRSEASSNTQDELRKIVEERSVDAFCNIASQHSLTLNGPSVYNPKIIFQLVQSLSPEATIIPTKDWYTDFLKGIGRRVTPRPDDMISVPQDASIATKFVDHLIEVGVSPESRATDRQVASDSWKNQTVGDLIGAVFGMPTLSVFRARHQQLKMNLTIQSEIRLPDHVPGTISPTKRTTRHAI